MEQGPGFCSGDDDGLEGVGKADFYFPSATANVSFVKLSKRTCSSPLISKNRTTSSFI